MPLRKQLRGDLLCVLLAGFIPLLSHARPFSSEEEAQPEKRRSGPYLGVLPGVNNRAPNKPRRSRRPLITWLGFQMRQDGGSRVFVQGTQTLTYELEGSSERKLRFFFPRSRLHTRIERLPLDASYFPAVVDSVKAHRRRGGVLVEVALRESAHHEIRQQGVFLFIDFPAPLKEVEAPEAATERRRESER